MKVGVRTLRDTLACVLVTALGSAAVAAGCGGGDGSSFADGTGNGADTGTGGSTPGFGDGTGGEGGAGDDQGGTLDVTPATATIAVTVTNGVVSATPATQAFAAAFQGAPVTPTWLLDRGELGDLDANGVFTPNGKNAGDAVVTAQLGKKQGTAALHVTVTRTQNGADQDTLTGPYGNGAATGAAGVGGVGGPPIGGAVADADRTKLLTATPVAGDLAFLYPYDKTVFPRGLLAPMLMWSTAKTAKAFYVKLAQNGFTFEGTYAVPGGLTTAQQHQLVLENSAWVAATNGNTGDPLVVTFKILGTDGVVYGPITRSWTIAPGVLKGTVYYSSYDSKLTLKANGDPNGGIIKIKPRSPTPELAIPYRKNQCTVCHTVSADGSTLWSQDGVDMAANPTACPNGDIGYCTGASYDLTSTGASAPTRSAYAWSAQNTQNNRKFAWSAPYPDGSFALASAHWGRETYTQSNSTLFARGTGAEVASNGLKTAVVSAVTPAFSPDGRKVSFNFWEGPGAGGVTAGNGHSLAIMDFDCGAAAGSTKCVGDGKTFSNLRQIFAGSSTTWPGWPSFVPDGKAVVFHNTIKQPQAGSTYSQVPVKDDINNAQLTTWGGANAEIWVAQDATPANARRLDLLNGTGPNGTGTYLPTNSGAQHGNDSVLNYNPTVNPVPTGGYYWVVFTSRRMYGNAIQDLPFGANGDDQGGRIKKLWVAAIDIANPNAAADPSHPAFYLPGQELAAGNTRGYWSVDPCHADGQSCETGDECCGGFCRKDAATGALACMAAPPACANEFEKCTTAADCCTSGFTCIANRCARPGVK